MLIVSGHQKDSIAVSTPSPQNLDDVAIQFKDCLSANGDDSAARLRSIPVARIVMPEQQAEPLLVVVVNLKLVTGVVHTAIIEVANNELCPPNRVCCCWVTQSIDK